MLHTTTLGVATEIGITLVDSSNNSVSGKAYTDVTVQYKKNGGSFLNKVLLSGEWTELGDGIYKLTFSAAELDTVGFFRILVSGTGFVTYCSDILIVDDYLTVAEQIISIKEQLFSKVNIRDANTLFAQLEIRQQDAERRLDDLQKRLQRALAAVNASKQS